MRMNQTDYVVVGKGLIGSAAARYLGMTGKKVVLIGPDEPDDWSTHPGVFGSHYDEGRITRTHDPDPVWALLAQRSIAQYRTLENESGLPFHHKIGSLRVGLTPEQSADYLPENDIDIRRAENSIEELDEEALRNAYPFLHFPKGLSGFSERGVAGYINPRLLIRAQVQLAERGGVEIVRERVSTVKKWKDEIEVETTGGETYRASRVLISAGAYSNSLLTRWLDLTPRARTITLAETGELETARLKAMPTIILSRSFDPVLNSVYILPPIRYPDGKFYIKIGGDCEPVKEAHTAGELGAWFRAGGDVTEAANLKAVLLDVIPHLSAVSFLHKPCVVTYTSTNRPFIDQIDDGLYVATGGCGAAAKSSNEIGRLSARLVHTGSWKEETELDEKDFRVHWA
jgi:sarcosine oxidase